MSDTGDVAIQNGGLLDLTDLQLTKGTISGGTVGVKETTIASVKVDGVIDAASVGSKTLQTKALSPFPMYLLRQIPKTQARLMLPISP